MSSTPYANLGTSEICTLMNVPEGPMNSLI